MARSQNSGQAEQYKHDWSLVNVTVDGLRLNQQQTQSLVSKEWDVAGIRINHINSLDILRDIEWQSGHLAAFDASIETSSYLSNCGDNRKRFLSASRRSHC
ncbi:AsmA family protein [Vibrio chagasii]|nr:AsmA family protein [Vibrio chagasii]